VLSGPHWSSHIRLLWSFVTIAALMGFVFYGCGGEEAPSESSCKANKDTPYFFDGKCLAKAEWDAAVSKQCLVDQKGAAAKDNQDKASACKAASSTLVAEFDVSYSVEKNAFTFTYPGLTRLPPGHKLELRVVDGRCVEVKEVAGGDGGSKYEAWEFKSNHDSEQSNCPGWALLGIGQDRYADRIAVAKEGEFKLENWLPFRKKHWDLSVAYTVADAVSTDFTVTTSSEKQSNGFGFGDYSLFQSLKLLKNKLKNNNAAYARKLVGLEFTYVDTDKQKVSLRKKDQVIHGDGLQYLLSKYKPKDGSGLVGFGRPGGDKDELGKQVKALVKGINEKVGTTP